MKLLPLLNYVSVALVVATAATIVVTDTPHVTIKGNSYNNLPKEKAVSTVDITKAISLDNDSNDTEEDFLKTEGQKSSDDCILNNNTGIIVVDVKVVPKENEQPQENTVPVSEETPANNAETPSESTETQPAETPSETASENKPKEEPVVTKAPEVIATPAPTKASVQEPVPTPKPTPVPVVVTPAPAPVETPAPVPISNDTYPNFSFDSTQESIITSIINNVNNLRAGLGLSQLKRDPVLMNIAQYRAKHMGDNSYFSHTYNGKQHYIEVAQQYGLDYQGIGENIAYAEGYNANQIADVFYNGWLNSSGHYANMTRDAWDSIGVGVYQNSNGEWYGVQIFCKHWD